MESLLRDFRSHMRNMKYVIVYNYLSNEGVYCFEAVRSVSDGPGIWKSVKVTFQVKWDTVYEWEDQIVGFNKLLEPHLAELDQLWEVAQVHES